METNRFDIFTDYYKNLKIAINNDIYTKNHLLCYKLSPNKNWFNIKCLDEKLNKYIHFCVRIKQNYIVCEIYMDKDQSFYKYIHNHKNDFYNNFDNIIFEIINPRLSKVFVKHTLNTEDIISSAHTTHSILKGLNQICLDLLLKNESSKDYNLLENELENIAPKYQQAIVKIRIGQGQYRERLINKYGCKCVLCNISVKEMLIASHIKEFSESSKKESLDINNGLLLCANHDKLFDNHLISFDKYGNILLSDSIKDSISDINLNTIIKINITDEIEKYMIYHRNKLK